MGKSAKEILEELKAQIDPCGFRAIKSYIINPDSEMRHVFVVWDEDDLGHMALISVMGELDGLQEFLATGRVKIAVQRMEGVEAGYRKYAMTFDEIPDNQMCQVISVPPVFVIFVTDRKWE